MKRLASAVVLVVSLPCAARADDRKEPPVRAFETEMPPVKPSDQEADYSTRRYEPAGFPLLGGDSDIGFEFGAVATLTRFGQGVRPYLWNMDLVLAASVKSGPAGADIAQTNLVWNWDVPALMEGRLRLNPSVSYQRTINQGYFGLGNASIGARPAAPSREPGRYFQFIEELATVRELVRIKVEGPWDVMLAPAFRYVSPGLYEGSKLFEDAASPPRGGVPVLLGVGRLSLGSLGAGFVYDTRDNEIFPTLGQYHQVGTKFVEGFPLGDGVRYGQSSAVLCGYVPLARHTVLALRGVTDLEYGDVPFYDLFTGGPFITNELPGGSSGVRGVPVGRYLGRIKAVANVEVRTLPVAFRVLGQGFRLGGDAFFDTGRVWSDYTFTSALDGSGLGLKYGVGAGAYLLWGQAALFRIECAYSPDAVAENPNFPIGVYVEDGTMF
ncbi:MAG TPA: BamA/TamA family outer membrane protein [Polyangiaceae bacterium]|jgi:hypothetical protein